MPDTPPPAARSTSIFRSKWMIALAVALMLGGWFRLARPGDIEFKIDELYTFWFTQQFVRHADNKYAQGIDRWLGMPTSKGFKNMGMSIWVFYALGSVSGADTPPQLARGVQVCNLAAILCLIVFACRCLRDREREWWLWTAALVCVNPFCVLFDRKIWPPCVLPVVMVFFLISWRSRHAKWGAFFWGLLGILAGQVEMAGFCYAGAFILWTALQDRKRTAWGWWLAGNVAGAIPALPWAYYMAFARNRSAEMNKTAITGWWRLFNNHFWADWFCQPYGIGLDYSLGGNFRGFLRYPLAGGHPTYGVAILLVLSGLLAIRVIGAGVLRWWRNRQHWRATWKSDQEVFTHSALQAGLWSYGILLTISCVRFERHYLILAFPLAILWAARQALPASATAAQWAAGRRILLALSIVNALLTMQFLDFIHANGGAGGGADYGKTYAKQLQDPAPTDAVMIKP